MEDNWVEIYSRRTADARTAYANGRAHDAFTLADGLERCPQFRAGFVLALRQSITVLRTVFAPGGWAFTPIDEKEAAEELEFDAAMEGLRPDDSTAEERTRRIDERFGRDLFRGFAWYDTMKEFYGEFEIFGALFGKLKSQAEAEAFVERLIGNIGAAALAIEGEWDKTVIPSDPAFVLFAGADYDIDTLCWLAVMIWSNNLPDAIGDAQRWTDDAARPIRACAAGETTF